MNSVTIIVPCFNEEAGLSVFYKETKKVVEAIEGYRFSFLFVDDGSRDGTLSVIKALREQHEDVFYLAFSRNFGKEAAMYAGLSYSKGDYCIIMDSDLQHPPAMIPAMIKAVEEGYDCCAARRTTRKGESKIRSAFSQSFYKISNRLSDVKLEPGAVDFRIMSRRMVDSILSLCEVERFSKGIFSWVGFDTKWLPYENVERAIGTTKWSFWGLFRYAINGITAFSVAPLRMIIWTGFVISVLAFLYIVITIIQTMMFGIDVPGYVTTLSAILFMGGIIELSIGILGEYLAHIFMESKKRPIFILKQCCPEEEKSHEKADKTPV